jgi:predicted nuclease with TOPRIM domain
MKIQTIDIKNFLALEQATLNLQAPINIIAGANEAGKSSIRDAIQWCLTGQARGLKTHQDQAYLIRQGARAAEVTIALADGQAIARKKTPKTPAGVTGPVPDDQVMASILCDPLNFLSLPDDKRREILFRLIPGLNPTGEEIFQKLKTMIPDFDTGSAIPHEVATLAAFKGFKATETEAITRRRIAKRVRDEAKVEEPEDRATIGGTEYILPDIKEEEVKDGIATLRAARDKLLQKRGKVEAQTDKLPEMESELAAMEENLSTPPTPGEIETLVKYLNINRPILEKLMAANEAVESGTADQLWPEACPAFPGSGLACPRFGAVAIPGAPPSDTAKVEKLKADLNEQQEEVERLGAELKVAQVREKAFNEFQESYQKLSDKITKLKEQQEQATATAQLDQKIAVLDARMKTGYELLDAVRDFWRKKEAAEAVTAKVAQAEKEITLYDALAKALAADGIPSQLIAEALEPFNKKLYLASSYLFPEYEDCPLVLTQDLEVYRSSPYACLSKSARYRAGICFQYVLATLAGARLLMIDEADILDPLNRAQLIDFLLAVRQDFDTILVFATSDEAKPSPVPEIQVWWLEDGRIAPVIPEMREQATG